VWKDRLGVLSSSVAWRALHRPPRAQTRAGLKCMRASKQGGRAAMVLGWPSRSDGIWPRRRTVTMDNHNSIRDAPDLFIFRHGPTSPREARPRRPRRRPASEQLGLATAKTTAQPNWHGDNKRTHASVNDPRNKDIIDTSTVPHQSL
jgi:hypothetical protein